MKKVYLILSLLFTITLGICGIVIFTAEGREFSPNENRYLQERPSLSFTAFVDGTAQKELTSFMDDQFPLRDKCMAGATALKKFRGAKDIGGVYLGKDGYFIEKVMTGDIDKQNYSKNLRFTAKFLETSSIPNNAVMLVPSAGTVLADKLPLHAVMYDADSLYKEAKNVIGAEKFLNLQELFTEGDRENLYYKTDHHWTTHGAYLAYTAYCAKEGFTPEPENLTVVSDSFLGSLYSKTLDSTAVPDKISVDQTIPPVEVTCNRAKAPVYNWEKLTEKDKYTVFFGGNYGIVTIKNKKAKVADNDQNLLIIKDSFANSFVPFLFNYYTSITMIDLRYYEFSLKSLVEKGHFSNVLFLYEISNFASDTSLFKLNQ